MPVSGTLPFYDISTSRDSSEVLQLATFTGALSPSSGSAGALASNETMQGFYRRAVGVLSGVSGGAALPAAKVSGLAQLQRELAARAADIEVGASASNASRVARANSILSASGEAVA